MFTDEPTLRSKLQLIELVKRDNNISRACKRVGFSRDTYYRIARQFETGGIEALRDPRKGKPNLRNRLDSSVQRAIIDALQTLPHFGARRIAAHLKSLGIEVSATGVRNVKLRMHLGDSNACMAG
jgi:transposase